MPRKTRPNFEKSLEELETLVQRMEQGDQPLEQALKDFEQGIALIRTCQQGLEQAEQKVQVLVERNGETRPQAFGGDEDA